MGTRAILLATLLVLLLTGCGRTATEPAVPPYSFDVQPTDFVAAIDNPYFPLTPGAIFVYEASTEEGVERIRVEVLPERRNVMGISATVVRDTVTLDGVLVEDTLDWYAQDRLGNVWYLGEEVSNYQDGAFLDRAGSWEAGVDGALPGIIMHADPAAHIGQPYRQEYYPGQAEDMAEVLAVGERIAVPAGDFEETVRTRDFTPLEPDHQEEKTYARGIGLVRAVNLSSGETERLLEVNIP